ncbi:MAG TPA: SDR family NAD(P)-dependent oxidoreductase, partial [Henriciella marina]|nr:SDR family NAD(P)-dependent oxidoreductase [Henriciella marina]
MTVASRKLFLIGPGYSARELAAICKAQGDWNVLGTARSAEKADALRKDGIEAVMTDDADAIEAAAKEAHLL